MLKYRVEKILASLYEAQHQPQAALDHYHRYLVFKTQIDNKEKQKAGYRQRLRYEYETKEAALKAAQDKQQAVATAEIRRQKQLRYAITGGAVLLLLLALGLFNRFRYQRRATAAIQRERERSDELLRNILSTEVAEKLKNTGKTSARQFDIVTVLFSDVQDFTQLSEHLNPQDLVATLDTYFQDLHTVEAVICSSSLQGHFR